MARREVAQTPEEQERAAAWRRGEAQAREHPVGTGPMARGATTEGASTEGASTEGASTEGAITGARAAAAGRAFAAFAENVRDYAIFLMDPSGTIMFWGEGARLIKGWTKVEAEGAHLRLLYPPGGSEDGTAEAHLAWAATYGEYTGEGPRVRSNGASFWASVAITALRDDDGSLLGFAKLSRDLTARRAAEALRLAAAEAAAIARTEAAAASAAKNGFLATISHEIRTPVNAMLGYTELLELELDGPLTAGQRRYLHSARASGHHLLALITQVLDFSHVDGAERASAPSAVPIADVVAEALALMAPAAAARGLEVADAVRGSPLALTGWGDMASVRQILGNLLDNAVKFSTARDGHAGRITVRAGAATRGPVTAQLTGTRPWVYVCVDDTGLGISADRLDAVFEPFVQADMRLTRTHGGLGLGLAISRRLARQMGGDVTGQSQAGAGATFCLWLPAAPVASPAQRTTERTSQRTTPGPDAAAPGRADEGDRTTMAGPTAGSTAGPLRAVAEAVLGELERILHVYVARLRTDPGTPSAHAIDEVQIEDHVASFLGNLAATLPSLGEATLHAGPGSAAEDPTGDVRDGAAIQRVVAERHGAQRARLGWSESELRREYTILREELTAAVQRRALRDRPRPTADADRQETAQALAVLTEFLALAERLSLTEHRVTVAARDTASARDPRA